MISYLFHWKTHNMNESQKHQLGTERVLKQWGQIGTKHSISNRPIFRHFPNTLPFNLSLLFTDDVGRKLPLPWINLISHSHSKAPLHERKNQRKNHLTEILCVCFFIILIRFARTWLFWSDNSFAQKEAIAYILTNKYTSSLYSQKFQWIHLLEVISPLEK